MTEYTCSGSWLLVNIPLRPISPKATCVPRQVALFFLHHAPNEAAEFWPARAAEPATHFLRLSVPLELPATCRTWSTPLAFGHFGLTASFWPSADLDALPFPDRIMAMLRPNQGVCNLVQDGVQNLFHSVPLHEVGGQLDGLALVHAQAERLLAFVEGKRPTPEIMRSHQFQGERCYLLMALGTTGEQQDGLGGTNFY